MPSTTGGIINNTCATDPREEVANWVGDPMEFRIAWAKKLGMSDDKIRQLNEIDPPVNFNEEFSQYAAALEIENINSQG